MTTLKELNEMYFSQDCGATLEAYGALTDAWYEIGKLSELELELLEDIRIQQPEIDRDDLEWCGYGVPDESNCDEYKDCWTKEGFKKSCISVNKLTNNGYRHLYRYKQPRVVPYTQRQLCEAMKEKGTFVKSNVMPLDEICFCIKRFDKKYITFFDHSGMTYKRAYEICIWPDGSPFGVEVGR